MKKKVKIINQTGSNKTSTQQCPHCLRIFNLLTAKDHIPICEKTKNRPKPPPQKEDMEQTQRYRQVKYLRASSRTKSMANLDQSEKKEKVAKLNKSMTLKQSLKQKSLTIKNPTSPKKQDGGRISVKSTLRSSTAANAEPKHKFEQKTAAV